MASNRSARARGAGEALLWDLLTFERLMTGPIVHLIYWAGLGLLALAAFSTLGAGIGVALREASILGKLLAIPVVIGGLLVCAVGVLLWRSFCEFYLAIFRISDDLRAMREDIEAERNKA
ncbi:MAG TPA: DUF4282 domain-containing protein [Caulobacteraceae bacterium]|nr:DUF4282 domain-containing protein [Caulobacteraceae bacterium]